MTIASAIDDVIIAQGGTPDPTDTIADSLVNLAGVLAGENYPKDKTIEDAVTLLGEHIGGGGSGTEYAISCTLDSEPSSSFVYRAIWDAAADNYIKDPDSPTLDKAKTGDVLFADIPENRVGGALDEKGYTFAWVMTGGSAIYMPSSAITISAYEG